MGYLMLWDRMQDGELDITDLIPSIDIDDQISISKQEKTDPKLVYTIWEKQRELKCLERAKAILEAKDAVCQEELALKDIALTKWMEENHQLKMKLCEYGKYDIHQ